MTHRLAQMRGDPPIPQLDVTRPALAPTTALVLKQADAPRDSAVGRETEGTSPEPAPAFVEGERVMAYYAVNPTYVWTVEGGWRNEFANLTTRYGFRRPTAAELAKHWPEDKP